MSEPAEMEDALRSALEQLVRFHGERPWSYSDVTTGARVLTLTVQDTVGRQGRAIASGFLGDRA